MISDVMYVGQIISLIICILLPIGAVIYCNKTKGKNGGILFTVVLGMALAVLSKNLASILAGLLQLNTVQEFSYLLSVVCFAIIIAAVDITLRAYTLTYIDKTGLSFQRGMSFATGYIVGQCLSPAMGFFTQLVYTAAIRKGTFMDSISPDTEGYESALAVKEQLTSAPALTPYVNLLELFAICMLHLILVLLLVRGFLNNEKKKAIIIAAAVRLGYELIRQFSLALNMEEGGALYDLNTTLIISAVISILTLAAGVYAFIAIKKDFPYDKERYVKTRSQAVIESEERKKRLAWQEMNRVNTKPFETPVIAKNEDMTPEVKEDTDSEVQEAPEEIEDTDSEVQKDSEES